MIKQETAKRLSRTCILSVAGSLLTGVVIWALIGVLKDVYDAGPLGVAAALLSISLAVWIRWAFKGEE